MKNQNRLLVSPSSGTNLPQLDGLRGTAIILVVLAHYFVELAGFKIGWIGLNLFFILSGFLITQSLFKIEHYSGFGFLASFYGRRVLRIFPLYYAVLFAFFWLLPFLSSKGASLTSELVPVQNTYWLYVSNWQIILHGLNQQPVLFHFWSLAVEEQFYLLWPILFLTFRSFSGRFFIVVLLILISIMQRLSFGSDLQAYLSSFTAMEPLLLGCLTSLLFQARLLQAAYRCILVAGTLAGVYLLAVLSISSDYHISNPLLFRYGYSAIDIFFTALLCSVLIAPVFFSKISKILAAPWLMWAGKYSYGLYVFHWIILKTLVYKWEALLNEMNVYPVASFLIPRITGLFFSCFVSLLSYHFFERYFLNKKSIFSQDFGKVIQPSFLNRIRLSFK
jgi:peptidoglycan/LPS O-acetylase OafA/YrhL